MINQKPKNNQKPERSTRSESLPAFNFSSLQLKLRPAICLAALLCCFLSGCATTKIPSQPDTVPTNTLPQLSPDDQSATDEQAQAQHRADANRRRQQSTMENTPDTSAPAVLALREQADKALLKEDTATANLLLERALRIDPSDPATYLQLARLRLINQEYAQAGALARRGLSLSPPESVEMPLKEILLQAQNPELTNTSS